MGFRLADRIPLVFTGQDGQPLPAYDACHIVVRAIGVDTYGTVGDLLGDNGIDGRTRAEDERIRAIVGHMVDSVVEWNLENANGDPTPITVDGLLGNHPRTLVFAMFNTWRAAQRDGPAPFEQPSNDGAPLAEIPVTSLAS